MALKIPSSLGKALYGTLFVFILPAALIAWASGAEANVSLPALRSVWWGACIAGAGMMLWAAGAVALWRKGGGLPMNAFPPPVLVTQGVYSVTAHPMYAGFTLLSLGAAVAYGSAAGLLLVSPMVALAAGALWWGYERIDLRARLGAPPRAAWLGVPFASPEPPLVEERLGSLLMAVAAPALAALMLHGAGLAGRGSYLHAQSGASAWTTLVIVFAAALAARKCIDLRDAVMTSWVGSLLLALFVLVLPSGPFGGRLPLAPDGVLLAATAMTGISSLLGGTRRVPGIVRFPVAVAGGLFLAGGGLIPSAESLAGAVVFTIASARWRIWKTALRLCEQVANCWRESDLGAVRLIHIGWLAALPACGSAAMAVVLLGPGHGAMIVWTFVFIVVGSALWAQIIEGSPALSRPYGFFGGVLAVVLFALLVGPPAFGESPWLVLGVFSAVAPWAQGLARLRCFANGCCHGAPCSPSCGVVYRNPRTRVVRIANLGGVPVHPTQLYSLTGNVLIGSLMMRLWAEGAGLALITGMYFSLMGLARLVEEAWRGEPQTPVYAGLRLYQWVSICFVVGGAALTAIPGSPRAPVPSPSLAALWTGLPAGALTWLVVSVDFPRSKRRFARLA